MGIQTPYLVDDLRLFHPFSNLARRHAMASSRESCQPNLWHQKSSIGTKWNKSTMGLSGTEKNMSICFLLSSNVLRMPQRSYFGCISFEENDRKCIRRPHPRTRPQRHLLSCRLHWLQGRIPRVPVSGLAVDRNPNPSRSLVIDLQGTDFHMAMIFTTSA